MEIMIELAVMCNDAIAWFRAVGCGSSRMFSVGKSMESIGLRLKEKELEGRRR